MYSDDEDFSVDERKRPLIHWFRKAFNAVFMALFRPFNSREVTVGKNSRSQQREYYKYEQFGASGLSLLSENFLRGNLLLRYLRKNPLHILETLNETYRISRDPSYLLIAADLCRFFAARTKGEKQIKYHLSAFRYCHRAFCVRNSMPQQAEGNTTENYLLLQELQIFNESIAGIFSCLKKKGLLDSNTFILRGIDGTEFTFEKPSFRLSVPRSAISDFSLCSDYSVKALRLINRHSGAGVPLVAKVAPVKLSRSLRTPPGLTIPVTLLIQVKELTENHYALFPCYQDTTIQETFLGREGETCADRWTLASDFTAPLACFMAGIRRRNLLSGMLHPVTYDEFAGLYMVEPYHPEKIPVVFIHGLMSSPETWGQMINILKYDPLIRQKYQFWFYYYSTGVPLLYSGKHLQQTLLKAQKEYCTSPEATRNFEKMVLVGHSMGGMLTRLLLQENPHRVAEYITRESWDTLIQRLEPGDRKLMEDFTVIPSLPFVRRAVFMAVPHRGAVMATKGLARLGIRLIRLPKAIMERIDDFKRVIKVLSPDKKMWWSGGVFVTGLDNLNPRGMFVQWSADGALKSGVTYHSIIGNKKAAGTPGGSDGIVPYLSSHLNGIESELIVKSDHGVHRHPAAIRELLRILHLHLEEEGQADEALRKNAGMDPLAPLKNGRP